MLARAVGISSFRIRRRLWLGSTSRPSPFRGKEKTGPRLLCMGLFHGFALGEQPQAAPLAAKISSPRWNGCRRVRVSLPLGGPMTRIDPAAGIAALAIRRRRDVPAGIDARLPQGQMQ